MNDAIGIIGFYFTLIGFISGLFFTRIDSWYGSVRTFSGSLSSLKVADNFRDKQSELDGLKASKPKGSFIGVGLLLTSLTILSWFVPVTDSPISPILFIYTPLIIIVLAYWIGGIVLLQKGDTLLSEANAAIKAGIRG